MWNVRIADETGKQAVGAASIWLSIYIQYTYCVKRALSGKENALSCNSNNITLRDSLQKALSRKKKNTKNSKGCNAVIRGYQLQRHFSSNRNCQLKEKRQKYSKTIAFNTQQQQLNELAAVKVSVNL